MMVWLQRLAVVAIANPCRYNIPKFGLGSRSCAGREKRTAARSETPINLEKDGVSFRVSRLASRACWTCCDQMVLRYLLKIPRKVLNLELSSGAFSAGAPEGVAARELSRELRADVVAEPGWAFSGARSAMVLGYGFYSRE
jgi:hypothetical protein